MLAGNDLCQGAQGRHGRRPRLCIINRRASTNGCGKNCAARGDLVEILAPSEPEGGTFEGPDGAVTAWELVDLPSGWVQFQEMDRHFWPLLEGFDFSDKFREQRRVALSGPEK